MNSEEFKKLYVGDEDECYEVGGEGCTLVETLPPEIDGKTVFQSDVYSVGDDFFMVCNSRANTGYWGDSKSDEPEVYKVVPIMKTVTDWKTV
jgi:hypothetical protein